MKKSPVFHNTEDFEPIKSIKDLFLCKGTQIIRTIQVVKTKSLLASRLTM